MYQKWVPKQELGNQKMQRRLKPAATFFPLVPEQVLGNQKKWGLIRFGPQEHRHHRQGGPDNGLDKAQGGIEQGA